MKNNLKFDDVEEVESRLRARYTERYSPRRIVIVFFGIALAVILIAVATAQSASSRDQITLSNESNTKS